MSVTTSLVYDIRLITHIRQVDDGLQIRFGDGSTAQLDASHPRFEVLRIHAEANRGRPVPVGVELDRDRIMDLNTAHDSRVHSVCQCAHPNRLRVALWGFGPLCYLTRDHPEFQRLRSTLIAAAESQTTIWLANFSEMVEDDPTTEAEEFEIWWKIMDVRTA